MGTNSDLLDFTKICQLVKQLEDLELEDDLDLTILPDRHSVSQALNALAPDLISFLPLLVDPRSGVVWELTLSLDGVTVLLHSGLPRSRLHCTDHHPHAE
jgi:hypothetical protein